MKTKFLTILLASTALAVPAVAQPVEDGIQQPFVLDEIILSGGLTPVPADGYARAYSVLTADEIEERGITTVQDALRAMPGVSVSSSGASLTQVRMRGGEADHTLILIDGIEAAGGADEYYLSGLEAANIERIEVLRGPQSVYYGSNASAGVINIITDKGAEGLSYGGTFELGNGASASARVSQRTERGGIALNLSALDDHGFDHSGDGGEDDGIRRKTLGVSADWQATDDLRFGTTLRWADETYDYDASAWDAQNADQYIVDSDTQFSNRKEFQGSVWAEFTALDGRMKTRLEHQDSMLRQAYQDGPYTRGETAKEKLSISYALDGQQVEDARHLMNVLAERQRDQNSVAPAYRRDMKSVALEYRAFLDAGVDIQAGLRHDDNKVFEDFTSWNLGVSWELPDHPVRLHASAGSALVNPSYYELYANDDFTVGNPRLSPEINRGFDLGAEFQLPGNRGTIDVTYFREKLEDEITYIMGGAPGGRATYENQSGESRRKGVEVSANTQVTDDLGIRLSYTYLDAKNPDGSVEVRRPRHELGLSATLAVLDGRGSVTTDVRRVAGNWDQQFWGNFPTVEMDDYTVVNLSAGYDLTQNVRLTGRVTNLFDQDYSDVWGYASQGRTAYVGLQAEW